MSENKNPETPGKGKTNTYIVETYCTGEKNFFELLKELISKAAKV